MLRKKRSIKKLKIKNNNESCFTKLMNNPMTIIIFLTSIIINFATFISSIDTIQSKYNDFWIWFGSSAQFSGKWNNSREGYMDGIYPETIVKNNSDITIIVDLKIKDHQVDGIIVSSSLIEFCFNNLKKTTNLKINIAQFCEKKGHMLLNGNKSPFKNNFDAEVFGYESGQKVLYSTLNFKVNNKELEITNKHIGKYSFFSLINLFL